MLLLIDSSHISSSYQNFSQHLGLTIGQLHQRPAATTDPRIDDLVKKLNIAQEVFRETDDNLSGVFVYDDYTLRQRHKQVWLSLDFSAGHGLKSSLVFFDTNRCYSSFEAVSPFSFCFLGWHSSDLHRSYPAAATALRS